MRSVRRFAVLTALGCALLLALPALPAAAHPNTGSNGLTDQVCDVTGYVSNPPSGPVFEPDPSPLHIRNGFACVGVTDTTNSSSLNLVLTAKGCVKETVACIGTQPDAADTLLDIVLGSEACPDPGEPPNSNAGLCGLAGGAAWGSHTASMSDLGFNTAVNEWGCSGYTSGGRVGLVVATNFTMNCDGSQESGAISFDAHGYSVTAAVLDPLDLAGPGKCDIKNGHPCVYIAGVAMFSTQYMPPATVVCLPGDTPSQRIRVLRDPDTGGAPPGNPQGTCAV